MWWWVVWGRESKFVLYLVILEATSRFFMRLSWVAGALVAKTHAAMKDYGDVDRWIAQLMECKPLSEAEVTQLCARV
jgi:hypothetical protein